jgi:hypothetical protein
MAKGKGEEVKQEEEEAWEKRMEEGKAETAVLREYFREPSGLKKSRIGRLKIRYGKGIS